LGKKGIIQVEFRIEPNGTQWRQDQLVVPVVASLPMMRNESSQIRDDYAVIVQKKNLYMSFEFNHAANLLVFF
jgi:hypothetical protein